MVVVHLAQESTVHTRSHRLVAALWSLSAGGLSPHLRNPARQARSVVRLALAKCNECLDSAGGAQATFPTIVMSDNMRSMLHWKNQALFALAGLAFGCSGRLSSQGSATQGGGTTASDVSSGGDAGSKTSGGSSATGGSNGTSGYRETGGVAAVGGSKSSGGTPATGGSSSTGGTTGAAGATSAGTKRGIAANVAPGAAFYPAVRWWYNWAIKGSGANVGLEFVPMFWNQTSVSSALPSGSKYVLGFNEPNFFSQANLSATQAASDWPALQVNADSAGVGIVGPAMNFCGPAAQCHGTDPYQYLKDFFAACTNCQVDYIAVHWYNCDLPSLRDYLEPGGSLEGFEQFNKPIWLTEFSCDTSASAAQQEAYMRAAIPYLEGNSHVFRYSWFSASPIPNAQLVNSDGTPTALGQIYISL